MGNEEDLGPRTGGEGQEPPPEVSALAERVARLESELAALQRQIASGVSAQPATQVYPTPARTAPPPPPPIPVSQSAVVGPPRSAAPARPPNFAQPAKPQESLEDRLGSQVFNRIAIVLILIGTAYFLKMAIDRGWITPIGRVIAGLVAGAGLVVWSERFRHKGFAPFSYSLKALGSGVLYLSLWAAFHYFHLLTAPVALILMMLVTAWNAYMAWAQDSELLAAYALAGGMATPLLLSTGGNHETFLFTYLLAIDIATIALVRLKTWPRLLLGAFPATVVFFIGWYAESFVADELAVTSFFIALFGIAFASVPLLRDTGSQKAIGRSSVLLEDILLPLTNAAFVALAFYSVLQDSGHRDLLPWLMTVLAAAYLGIMRVRQTAAASAIHLSLAVVLLTIAIPLKASGHWITVSWLVEGLALLWVAAKLASAASSADSEEHAAEAQASRILRPLALGSLLLGFGGVCTHSIAWADADALPLLNKVTGTALTGVAVFAIAAWLALRTAASERGGSKDHSRLRWDSLAMIAFALVDLTAALLTLRELLLSWNENWIHPPFQTADFVTALIGLAVFACVIAVSHRIAAERTGENFWMSCAALSTIAFNLSAVLTGVREIAAIWGSSAAGPDAVLQQALAISAFLMLYGAALLAAGFWRRSGFLRWQALALLVFTIFKTFLYDMRSLSQGYRVVSLLGLGALLMAISFAYQKDLLHLREPERTISPEPESNADSEAAR